MRLVRQLVVVRLLIPNSPALRYLTQGGGGGDGAWREEGGRGRQERKPGTSSQQAGGGRSTPPAVFVFLSPRDSGTGTRPRKHRTTKWRFYWSIAQQQNQFMPLPSRRLPHLIPGVPPTFAAPYMVQTLTAVHRENETRTKKTKKERKVRMSPCEARRPPAKETVGVSEQPHHGGCELGTRMDEDPVLHQGGDGGEDGQRHAVCLKF